MLMVFLGKQFDLSISKTTLSGSQKSGGIHTVSFRFVVVIPLLNLCTNSGVQLHSTDEKFVLCIRSKND